MIGSDLNHTLSPDEQDALLAHYVRDAAAFRKIVAMYVARYGILPELGGPPPESPPADAPGSEEGLTSGDVGSRE